MPVSRFTAPFRRSSVVLAALLTGLSLPAQAVYVYSYTGPLFTLTTQVPVPGDPSDGLSFSEARISARLYSDAPLSAGATLADVRSISMTGVSTPFGGPPVPGPWWVIDYPFNPPYPIDPTAPPGSPGLPLIGAELSIGAIDANGLPSIWTVSISQDVAYGSRHDYIMLSSSNLHDGIDGGYETVVGYSGQSSGAAGVWQLAVAVPEPQAWLLMLGGIGAIGLWLRKRRGADAVR